jgi:TonB family protein
MNKYHNFFYYSFICHVIFIMMIVMKISLSEKKSVERYSLPSYLYSAPSLVTPSQNATKQNFIKKSTSAEKLNKNSDTSPLLKLLHEQIAAHQNYPSGALLLKQTGIVTVKFLLHPDGTIENLTLAKSSGVESLDQSALHSVSEISPVQSANLYLKQPEYLSVDVVFEA